MQEHQKDFVPKRYVVGESPSAKALSTMNEACMLFATENSIDTSWPMTKFDHIARAVISELYKGPYVGLNCNELVTRLMQKDLYRKDKRPESVIHLTVCGFIYDLIESDIVVANFPGRRELTLSPFMRQILDVSMWANQEVVANIESDLDKIVKTIPEKKEPASFYETAVAGGFTGTETQFLRSLMGDTAAVKVPDDEVNVMNLVGYDKEGEVFAPKNGIFIGAVIDGHLVRNEDLRQVYDQLKEEMTDTKNHHPRTYHVRGLAGKPIDEEAAQKFVASFKSVKKLLKK